MAIINCVALFYEAGKNGKDYERKEKFRVRMPEKAEGELAIKDIKETVR